MASLFPLRLVTSTTEGCTVLATSIRVCCKSAALGGTTTVVELLLDGLFAEELPTIACPTAKLPRIRARNSTALTAYIHRRRGGGDCVPVGGVPVFGAPG